MKKTFFAAFITTALISTPTLASDLYAGIKVGTAKHWIDSTKYQENANASGIFLGYILNPNVALEVEAVNLGSIVYSLATVNAVGVSVIGTHHANENVSLFAKIGVAHTKEEVIGVIAHHTGVSLGAGGQYEITPTVGVRLAWEYYRYGGENNLSLASASLYSIGALFRF